VSATRPRRPPDWSLSLARRLKPINKTEVVELSTLHDAAAFILELPKQERAKSAWIEVAGALLTAATTKRPADILVATDQVEASLRANGYLLGSKRQR
jgi:hypothetical protein